MTFRVAIVGAGIAGLGVLCHLLEYPNVEATLFDPKGIGGGASGVSTGLLHPFPARDALRSWRADEGMKEAKGLLAVAEIALGRTVCQPSGILKIAITEKQKIDFRLRAENDVEAIWMEESSVLAPYAVNAPALWIPEGTTVYSQLYLEGLWRHAEKKGAKWEAAAVRSLEELESYDAIVLATGSETLNFPECRHLPLKTTKGQALICRWPEKEMGPLTRALLSLGHLTPTFDPSVCQIGSTYERQYSTTAPDPAAALPLLEKAAAFYPPARNFEVLEIRSGVRISPTVGYKPIVQKVSPKAWVFTGLGSRGMLYHALLGKELAAEIYRGILSL